MRGIRHEFHSEDHIHWTDASRPRPPATPESSQPGFVTPHHNPKRRRGMGRDFARAHSTPVIRTRLRFSGLVRNAG